MANTERERAALAKKAQAEAAASSKAAAGRAAAAKQKAETLARVHTMSDRKDMRR